MADPLSIITAIISTVSTIQTWCDQHQSKEQTIRQLRITVRNISGIISPLKDISLPELEHTITKATATHSAHRSTRACLADLQEALECTRGHLQKWSEKGGFMMEIVAKLLPSIASGELQDDQKWLAQRCQDLQLAFNFMLWKKALALDGREGTGHDAMGNELPNPQLNLVQAQNQSPAANDERGQGKNCSNPILLWIDDEPHKYQDLVSYAQSANIRVVTLLSTAHAKQWIISNDALLRQTDKSGSLRIISDNARFESPTLNRGEPATDRTKPGKEWVLNAGEQMLRFIRERGLRAPVLIWTRSANITALVLEYQNAGSTLVKEVAEAFIAFLAYGETIDSWYRWIGCELQPVQTPNAAVSPGGRLMIWVDDEPEKWKGLVNFAGGLGVRVVTFTSTVHATQWMTVNADYLRGLDRFNSLRFVSDNARLEHPFLRILPDPAGVNRNTHHRKVVDQPPKQWNTDAGEQIVRFVRETLRLDTPVLICTRVATWTSYVLDYTHAGSTTDTAVLEEFIRGFADGEVPDGQRWCGSQLLSSSRPVGAGIRGGKTK